MFHINKRHFPKRAECTVVLSSYVLLSITLDSTDSRHMKRSHWPALSRTGPVVPQLQPGTPWVVDSPRPLCPVCVKGLDASPRSHFLPMAAIFIARVHSLQLHTCVGDFFFFFRSPFTISLSEISYCFCCLHKSTHSLGTL